MYYWRTELEIDSAEQSFLKEHAIRRVYCRYFDVVMGEEGEPLPNATVAFTGKQPEETEWVPTVFITENCMRAPHDSLAVHLVRRIAQISETNDIQGVREIQVDCDYTARSRASYYRFLQEVRDEARKQGWSLSATIRLHQLSMPAPPVDEGVLMLYNTGDPMRFQERNPVLDLRDVQPYLNRLPAYPLPLRAAYPVFLWQRKIHGVRIEHEVPADEILRVKKAVETQRADLRQNIVVYHLSKENINRYTPDEYEKIYHH